MKVKDLLETLSKENPNADVYFWPGGLAAKASFDGHQKVLSVVHRNVQISEEVEGSSGELEATYVRAVVLRPH